MKEVRASVTVQQSPIVGGPAGIGPFCCARVVSAPAEMCSAAGEKVVPLSGSVYHAASIRVPLVRRFSFATWADVQFAGMSSGRLN